ncbi:MAG: hypothetical protein ACI9BW_003389 [Gammaproteobacteria bacterium]|jgi:hypothetical protein
MGRGKSRFYSPATRVVLARSIVIALLLLQAVLVAHANTAAPNRSPVDMSADERRALMELVSLYESCIYSEAMSRADDFADVRHAADFALRSCQEKLGDLRTFLVEAGFAAGYSTGFSTLMRNRTARKILPELAIRASRK